MVDCGSTRAPRIPGRRRCHHRAQRGTYGALVESGTRNTTTVELLADRPDLLIPLAHIRWNEWGDEPAGDDLTSWIDTTRRESGRTGLPVTLVAVDATSEAVGGIGLIPVEHPELAYRGPWVVGTIVRADRRGQGIGRMLVQQLILWAANAGISRLWVATGGQAVHFYHQCGFTIAEIVRLSNGEQPTILTAQPTPQPAARAH